ncbi:hypothetical protein [Nannocystis sp.]|uniref:hypothetical protein n=1 Tax=Nannocystis sp. TaxID=1962667 RepID=UPI0025F4A4DE|nr:hypothetical protein [Nannocystis sp.]MBK7828607.1 hypothetical protein [Nannocystis sp.]
MSVKPPKDVWPVWDYKRQEELLDYLRQPKRRIDKWSDNSQVFLDDEPCESEEERAAREWADDCLKILRGQVPG